jgi:hypothetical protein
MILLLSASVAQAAVTIANNYVGSVAPTLDSTYGTLELAINMGGDALTRDGIAFTAAGTTPGGAVRTFLSGPISVIGTTEGGSDWGATSLSGVDPLFYSVAYSNSSQGYSISLTGLDAGRSYQMQFLFGDPRTTYPHTRTVTISDNLLPSPNTSTAILSYGGVAVGDEFAVLTAVVSGSTSFTFTSPSTGPGTGGPLIAGLVVQSVPEPSAVLLGGFAVLGLLRRRR